MTAPEQTHQIERIYGEYAEARDPALKQAALSRLTRRVGDAICPEEAVRILVEAVSAHPIRRDNQTSPQPGRPNSTQSVNDLPAVARAAGLKLVENGHSSFRAHCPFHDDDESKLQISRTTYGWAYRCWAEECAATGDTGDFIKRMADTAGSRNADGAGYGAR